jgi:ABC-type Zn uptake system ZnuABC Zn-binding protein ZnuA
LIWTIVLAASLALAACGQSAQPTATTAAPSDRPLTVLAAESFLADIAQNVAGDQATVATLIPAGIDPHAFEPTPQDVARIADSTVLIVNGSGFEEWLANVLDNAGGQRLVIEASAGLATRTPDDTGAADHDHAVDPHFWLDPTKVEHYVAAIRDGLAQADPAHAAAYAANAEAYIVKLKQLDAWIAEQVNTIPAARRLLVTNHESMGYYADRYGLKVVGAVIPSFSASASPSAQQLAQLADTIRATGAPAIFLETGSNPQLAQQLGTETGVKVVTDLYSHSLTGPDGPAPTYLDMMRYNTQQIVAALK